MQENCRQKMKDYIVKFNLRMEYFFFSNEIINYNFSSSLKKMKEEFMSDLEELNNILIFCESFELVLNFLNEEKNKNTAFQENTKGFITLNFLKLQEKHLDLIIALIEKNFKDIHENIKNEFLFYLENVAATSINYKTKMLELNKKSGLNIKKNKEFDYEFENDEDLSFNLTKYMVILSIFFETAKEEKAVSLENYMKTKKELISNIIELHSILKDNNIENIKLMEENEIKIKIITEKNNDDFKKVFYTIVSNYFSEIIKIMNKNNKEKLPDDVVIFLKKMLKISKF